MKLKILLTLLIIVNSLNGQGINNKWMFGYDCCAGNYSTMTVDFSAGNFDVSVTPTQMSFSETNSVTCDSSGNLLFYSNGVYIANALHDTMLNGAGLNPGSFTTSHAHYGLTVPQGNLVIPIPGEPTEYHLFHETADDPGATYAAYYLYYSIIDMTLNGGLGGISQKNVVLLYDTLVTGRLTANKHANGRDWWLVSHKLFNGWMYKFLITPFGIQGPYGQDLITPRDVNFGQAVFSQQGNKFAYYETSRDLDIWDFDRCTGDFSNLIHIDINDSMPTGGVAFSPNGRFLYVPSTDYIYQFDLSSSNVAASKITIGVYDGTADPNAANFYLSHLAPNGKIYINCANSSKLMHVINSPDSSGVACDFCQHCIILPGTNAFTMPNHPNYFLGAGVGTICDSLTNSIENIILFENSISIYPNPAKDYFIISMPSTITTEGFLEIANQLGKRVEFMKLSINTSFHEINTSKLEPGIYFVTIQIGQRALDTKKIVIIR